MTKGLVSKQVKQNITPFSLSFCVFLLCVFLSLVRSQPWLNTVSKEDAILIQEAIMKVEAILKQEAMLKEEDVMLQQK